jgi:hypothetical protein
LEDRAVPSTFTVTNQNDSGAGSLRDTLAAAQAGDQITFRSDVHNINLKSGELLINKSVDIEGTGANNLSISGSNQSRVFDIARETTGPVTIAGLTITGGRSDKTTANVPGVGGGILNLGSGPLNLNNDVVSYNVALGDKSISPLFGAAAAAWGGGAANFGTLNVSGTTFFANLAQGGDNSTGSSLSGLGTGGGIFNGGSLNVTGSTFAANVALGGNNNVGPIHTGHGVGGGISSGGSQVTVTGSTFTANLAQGGNNNQVTPPVSTADGPDDGFGGGLAVFLGTASVNQTTFAYNLAHGGKNGSGNSGSLGVGGGAFILNYSGVISPLGSVSATFTNSVFTGNAAVGGDGTTPNTNGGAGQGGGLATVSDINGATSTVSGSTFTENLAQGGAGCGSGAQQGAGLGGGLFSDNPSVLTLSTSHVNDNTANGNPGRGGGVASLGTFNNDGSNDISGNHASTSNPDVYNPVSL